MQASNVYTSWSADNRYGPPVFSGSYDKNYTQEFGVTSTVTVSHNLQKFPSVTVLSSANDEVVGDVTYVDLNTLTVQFTAPFSGMIICN